MSIWLGLLFGLVGGIHCLGMCGPIMMALPFKNKFKPQIVYHLARTIIYSLLGVLTGLFGASLKASGVHESISLITGIMLLLVVSFRLIGKSIDWPFSNYIGKKSALVWKSIFEKNEMKSWFVAGLLNGLLPCGFVYIALTSSVVFSNVYLSVLYMFGFGLGTIPFLVLPVFFRSRLGSFIKLNLTFFTYILPVSLGILLILRGLSLNIPFISPALDVAGCCG